MSDIIYNVPLRSEFQKAPKYKRSKKAITALREFLLRHVKVDNIKLSKALNEAVWANGIKNPPHHIKVSVKKLDDTTAEARLFGEKQPEDEDKKEKKLNKKEAKETPKEKKADSSASSSDKKSDSSEKTDKEDAEVAAEEKTADKSEASQDKSDSDKKNDKK